MWKPAAPGFALLLTLPKICCTASMKIHALRKVMVFVLANLLDKDAPGHRGELRVNLEALLFVAWHNRRFWPLVAGNRAA